MKATPIKRALILLQPIAIITSAALIVSCSKKTEEAASSSFSYDATKPSGIIKGVGDVVASAGSEMTSSALGVSSQSAGDVQAQFTESQCDTHGSPTTTAAPSGESDPKYPGLLTYCKMKINDGSPDTIQGGFALVKSVSCAVENAGLTFDGTPRSVTITVDTTCFTAAQVSDMGVSSIAATVTASAPASFNSYFTNGVVIDITSMGMTFKLGTKVTGSKVEFITFETSSSTKNGATYGSMDFSTGVLRSEARMERLDCTTSGSCGWNRHIKLYSTFTMSGLTPVDMSTISFAYSNIQTTPGQSSNGGVLITASGDLTSGIKARLWQATNGSGGASASKANTYTAANWTEVTNTKCYTSSSETASSCGAGIGGFSSNTYFLLSSSGYTTGFTDSSTFLSGFSGATYTSVDPSSD